MSADSTPAVTIRPASSADFEACFQIDHSCSTDTVWQMGISDGGKSHEIAFRPTRLPRSLKVVYSRQDESLLISWRYHAIFFVAMMENRVIGYINIRDDIAEDTAWVADMAVAQAYRLRGVGKTLLSQARDWAFENQRRRLIVETHTRNYPAIQFLQRGGLTFCGYNERYYTNQDIAVFFGQVLY